MYPPQSPTRMTNDSILKVAGAFHGLKTSRIRFCAFSYSIGEPCGRSFQVIMYFMGVLLVGVDFDGPILLQTARRGKRSASNVLTQRREGAKMQRKIANEFMSKRRQAR